MILPHEYEYMSGNGGWRLAVAAPKSGDTKRRRTSKRKWLANGRKQEASEPSESRSRATSSVYGSFQRLHEVAPLGLEGDREDVITRRPGRLTDREEDT